MVEDQAFREYKRGGLITENTPLELIWQDYFTSLIHEIKEDGLMAEAEFLVDIGFSFLAWDELRLPPGMIIKIDSMQAIRIDSSFDNLMVYELYHSLDDLLHETEDMTKAEKDAVTIKRIMIKSNILSNAVYQNAFLRREGRRGLKEHLKRMS